MWWEEEGNSWVLERIGHLSQARGEGRLPGVTVIGSTWTEEGERTLFLGIRPHRDPRPWQWAAGERAQDRLVRWLVRRYGPLPSPGPEQWEPRPDYPSERDDGEGGVGVLDPVEPTLRQVVRSAFLARRLGPEERMRLLLLRLEEADPGTYEELAPFELPAITRVGYLGPIRPRASKGSGVFRSWRGKRATAGSVLQAGGRVFLTTAGHLGAAVGQVVYRRRPRLFFGAREWGRVAAVTCPEEPDAVASAAGVDVAAVAIDRVPGGWQPVVLGNPRAVQRDAYFRWKGGVTGAQTGAVVILAHEAEAMEGFDYEHSLMVLGHQNRGGAGGDSGCGFYDSSGRLHGYFVGTHGGPDAKGVATAVWFQAIDAIHPYLEERCGPIDAYLGDLE